jgi:hypothetical protein
VIFTYKIRYSSVEKNKKGIFLGRTLQTVYTCNSDSAEQRAIDGIKLPSKSSATISASSVGETDNQTPSKQGRLLFYITNTSKTNLLYALHSPRRKCPQDDSGQSFSPLIVRPSKTQLSLAGIAARGQDCSSNYDTEYSLSMPSTTEISTHTIQSTSCLQFC